MCCLKACNHPVVFLTKFFLYLTWLKYNCSIICNSSISDFIHCLDWDAGGVEGINAEICCCLFIKTLASVAVNMESIHMLLFYGCFVVYGNNCLSFIFLYNTVVICFLMCWYFCEFKIS